MGRRIARERIQPLIEITQLLTYQKHSTKVLELETKLGMLVIAGRTEIRVVHSKNEPLPILADEDLANLLIMLARNLKTKRKDPFHIVITFPLQD